MTNDRQLNYLRDSLKAQVVGLKNIEASIEDIEKAASLILVQKGKVIVTGVGKSAFVGMKLSATLSSLDIESHFIHPVDALHGDAGRIRQGDSLIAISFSGESHEVIKLLKHLKKNYRPQIVSITGKKNSTLAKLSSVVICTPVEKEGSPLDLAPMTSTTSALVAGDLLACTIVGGKGISSHTFARHHPGGSLGLQLIPIKNILKRNKKVPQVKSSDILIHVLKEITKQKRGVVGVVDTKNKVIGSITDGDIRRFLLKHESVKNFYAKDAMSHNPKTIPAQSSVKDALALMDKFKITSLFVVDDDKKLAGLIHMHDLVQEFL